MTTFVPRTADAALSGATTTKPRRRSRWISVSGIAALIGIAVLLIIAIIGPDTWMQAATERNIAERWSSASPQHLFGTDDIGRDIFARVMVAARLSLLLTGSWTCCSPSPGCCWCCSSR
jgi:ABC-type dipeptide/oligopeptide/nickel transport system permease subunit